MSYAISQACKWSESSQSTLLQRFVRRPEAMDTFYINFIS